MPLGASNLLTVSIRAGPIHLSCATRQFALLRLTLPLAKFLSMEIVLFDNLIAAQTRNLQVELAVLPDFDFFLWF